tara:strand:- start:682 stop:2040 length:1359 start_codon:yes stop_codon:yes gene_type:complete
MTETITGTDRSAGITYQDLLDTDTHPVPEVLRRVSPIDPGATTIPIERYISQEFHNLEVEKLWKKVWQMACHEDDIPDVGDYFTYEIADLSFLIVRTKEDTFKAYVNACLHRGRLLRETHGKRATELRCPFHGWAWNLDGTIKEIPCQWDFPHVDPEEESLPEVQVGQWGGFIFINPDSNAESFDSFAGTLGEHFSSWPLERRYKEAHVSKILRCNWKVAQEAFMEAYHVVATHPQILAGIGDANSQYDVYGNFARAITPNGTPSPHLAYDPSEQEMLDAAMDVQFEEPSKLVVPDGGTARSVTAAGQREALRPVVGNEVDSMSDAEFNDSFYFTLFPNFHPWGGFNRIVYRFRPNGNNPDESIMECMYLSPYPEGDKPPAAPIHHLGPDDDWTDAPELGMLGRVFNQDTYNLPRVQLGLHTTRKESIVLGNYGETKIRHFNELLERFLDRE